MASQPGWFITTGTDHASSVADEPEADEHIAYVRMLQHEVLSHFMLLCILHAHK